jgi:hypothetical protein
MRSPASGRPGVERPVERLGRGRVGDLPAAQPVLVGVSRAATHRAHGAGGRRSSPRVVGRRTRRPRDRPAAAAPGGAGSAGRPARPGRAQLGWLEQPRAGAHRARPARGRSARRPPGPRRPPAPAPDRRPPGWARPGSERRGGAVRGGALHGRPRGRRGATRRQLARPAVGSAARTKGRLAADRSGRRWPRPPRGRRSSAAGRLGTPACWQRGPHRRGRRCPAARWSGWPRCRPARPAGPALSTSSGHPWRARPPGRRRAVGDRGSRDVVDTGTGAGAQRQAEGEEPGRALVDPHVQAQTGRRRPRRAGEGQRALLREPEGQSTAVGDPRSVYSDRLEFLSTTHRSLEADGPGSTPPSVGFLAPAVLLPAERAPLPGRPPGPAPASSSPPGPSSASTPRRPILRAGRGGQASRQGRRPTGTVVPEHAVHARLGRDGVSGLAVLVGVAAECGTHGPGSDAHHRWM